MKSALAGFLAGLFAFGGVAAAQEPNLPPTVVDTTLDNGMRVVIVPNRLAPVVTTEITYGAGSVDDTIPGIAHATEHMLFRGTQETSSDQFANISTRIGAQYNAETSYTTTQYYFTFPSTYLDVVLHLEADRMQHATISAADWKNERGAIEQEVKAHLSNPLLPVIEKAGALMFGDSPWGKDPVGTIDGFEKMTAADIASFYHTWYRPNDATLVIAGDVDADAALAAVKEQFGSIASAAVPAHPPLVMQSFKTTAIDQQIDFPLPVALSAFKIPGLRDPDYAATEVLFGALDSGRGPFSDLILSGKVLMAVGIPGSFPDAGTGTLIAVARPGSDPKAALSALDDSLATYAQSGIPDTLVDSTKARLAASQAFTGATIPGEASLWSTARVYENTTPAALYTALAGVSQDDVDRVYRTYVAGANRVTLALAGNPKASISHSATQAAENVAVTAQDTTTLPAWTAPYFAAPLRAPALQSPPQIFHLKNGMTIAVRHEDSAPVVVMSGKVLTNTDMNEPRGKDGVAIITNTLMGRGTTTHDYKAYQAELDAISATIGTGADFSVSVESKNVEQAIALLAEGELHPAFASDQFSIVSSQTVQTLKASESLPDAKAQTARLYALYPPNDPHRRHATSATAASVTLADVKKWYAFAYRPELATVSVVGDVDPQAIKAAFEKYFGDWKAHGPEPILDYPPVRYSKHAKATSTTVTSSTSKQANVTLEEPLAMHRGDRDEVALTLANMILSGEGTGSMLFHDVRKAKGYVYSIDSSLDVARSSSTFELNYSSDVKNIEPAARAADATIERLRAYPPSAEDLVLAKAMLLSHYVVPLASYEGVADELLADSIDDLGQRDISRYYAEVLRTTPADVQHAMQRWIDPKKFTRVVVLPSTP